MSARSPNRLRREFSRRLAPFGVELVVLSRRLVGADPEAEEVLQAALASAWRRYASGLVVREFRTWIARFLVQAAASRRRARGRAATHSMPLSDEVRHSGEDAGEALVRELEYEALAGSQEELVERLDRRLDGSLRLLGETEREALLLRALLDLSYAEIADVQGTPRGAVFARLHRARLRLRAGLVDRGVTRPTAADLSR